MRRYQMFFPKKNCPNCAENNRTEEGRDWCLNHCRVAWTIDPDKPVKPQYKHYTPHKRKTGLVPQEVECLDTGAVYASAKALAELLGVSESAVCNCCRGRGITVKGKQYRYRGDERRQWIDPVVRARKPVDRKRSSIPVLDRMTGITYASCAETAEALGVGKTTVYRHLAMLNTDAMKRFEYVKEVDK